MYIYFGLYLHRDEEVMSVHSSLQVKTPYMVLITLSDLQMHLIILG
jgi:hypothetical protein